MPSVAVVGAGIAGLCAGRWLSDLGWIVTVFDKGRGCGGRISTRRADPQICFDHGAQYFTTRDARFAQVVDGWVERGVAAEWTGRIVKREGGDLIDTPAQKRYVGVPGMSAIATSLANGLSLVNSTRITRADRTSRGWTLSDESSNAYGLFDALIVAIPSFQASELLRPHPFADDAARLTMIPCWAVMLAYRERRNVSWDGAFVHGSPLSWVARNSSKPGRPQEFDTWVLHASGEWSAAHIEDPVESVGNALVSAFHEATGLAPEPEAYRAVHRWRFAQGSDPTLPFTWFDRTQRLAVAGDWLGGGRVEGAALSGWAAAEKLYSAFDSDTLA